MRAAMSLGGLWALGAVLWGCGPSASRPALDGAADAVGGSAGSAGSGGAAGTGAGGAGTAGMTGTGGVGPGGAGGSSGGGGNVPTDPDLVLLYRFDEAAGLAAADTSGFPGGPRDGTLMTVGAGTAAFSATSQVGTHALQLMGGTALDGGFVAIPSLAALAPTAVTLAAWFNMPASTGSLSPDVFSFSIDSTTYMSLVVNPTRMNCSFQIIAGGLPAQRVQSMAPISVDVWHHVAVVLEAGSPYTGTLYVDGATVATNDTMTLHPADLGATVANYVGRFVITAGMAYFTGSIDDFRVYRRALSPTEITALYGLR